MCVFAHLYSALRACLPPCFVQEACISLQVPAPFGGQMEEARHCGAQEVHVFLWDLVKYKMRY